MNKLRYLREINNLTGLELAKMMKIDNNRLSKIEHDLVHPNWNEVLKFAEIFRVKPFDIVAVQKI